MNGVVDDLDEEALAELRDDLGDAFDEFVAGFLRSADEALQAIQGALASGQGADAAARAHALKGTAGYLGATRMLHELGALQRAAQDDDAQEAGRIAQQLRASLDRLAPRLEAVRRRS